MAQDEWQSRADITPTVDEVREFLEIANDFTNPLEVVREAVSNAFDARAANIEISFWVEEEVGESVLKILLADDGEGMDQDDLQAFFDLGNSPRRKQEGHDYIGEKGHGTKVYFNSSRIEVETRKDGLALRARVDNPLARLHHGDIPSVAVQSSSCGPEAHGTEILITGYNNNRRGRFTHNILKDYILWFTKFGSFEEQFPDNEARDVTLRLKGVDQDEHEVLPFGHVFPEQSNSIDDLLDEHGARAPDFYVHKWVEQGSLPNFPEINYKAVFYVEGDSAKSQINPMIRRPGRTPEEGMYRVQDRYGLWLAKDYIPVERKNEWITTKGSEYTKFHAFFNCQAFRLTANRL